MLFLFCECVCMCVSRVLIADVVYLLLLLLLLLLFRKETERAIFDLLEDRPEFRRLTNPETGEILNEHDTEWFETTLGEEELEDFFLTL